ncbi:hypothetical protein Tco_0518637, partial [Tanacetum coccineum]
MPQSSSGTMNSQSSGAPVARSAQSNQTVNKNRAMPSKRPKRCCGSVIRSVDQISTTLPSRQANSTWNGVNAGK